MSNVKEVQGVEHTVQTEGPKESFGKKVKRKTLNFLAKNGVWLGAVTGGVAVGYLAGKHKTKKSIVVSQEALGEPKEDYKQKVYIYEEATRIRRVKISSEK